MDKLKRQFIPVDYELDLLKKMQSLKQAGRSVQEYTEEFYRILIRTGHAEADKEKVARYLNGLRPSIQEELNLVRMNSIEEAYQFALKVEEKLNKKFESRQNGRGRGGRSGGRSYGGRNEDPKKKDEASSSQNQRGNNSNRFQDQNNRDQRGRGRGQGSGRGGFRGTCFHCGEEGHRAFECPQRQGRTDRRNEGQARVAHVDEDARSSNSEDAERGETLINRRVLLSGENEPEQRRSLFRTRCKCEGKCCDVIIDSGSTDNLVSEEMVTKLKLKRQKHPHPYRIAWVQDDHKVMVSEQCLVKFKIGGYHDEVLCDIIPMDACHMLLDRPW